MKHLKIKCPRCSGPMWEEELPETPTLIDIVCIICGERKYFDKRKYRSRRKQIEEQIGKARPASR